MIAVGVKPCIVNVLGILFKNTLCYKLFLSNFRIVHDEMARYFTLPSVLETLFNLCYKLFGITIKVSSSKFLFIYQGRDDG